MIKINNLGELETSNLVKKVKSHAILVAYKHSLSLPFLFLFLFLSFIVDREKSKCGSERKCERVVDKKGEIRSGVDRERGEGADKDTEVRALWWERCVGREGGRERCVCWSCFKYSVVT